MSNYPFDATPTLENPTDVIDLLETFLRNAEEFDINEENDKGYLLQLDERNAKDGSNKVIKVAIGPIEIILQVNFSTWSASLKILFKVPFDGTVTLANVVGNLKDGIEVKIGFRKILGGSLGVKLEETTKAVVLFWDFHVFGKKFKGEKKLFNI